MIRARGLTKRYGGTRVLDGLSFEIAPGERVAILGGNGAGKTTLFRCLLGLTDHEGELAVHGFAAGPSAVEVRRRIGYVPQLPPVFDLTLGGFLTLIADVRGIAAERAASRLADLGLPPAGSWAKPMRDLSGGMLQKAYLALALAADCPVLLLDEPAASLDPDSRHELVRLLSSTAPDTTLLLASHRLEEIEPLTDRILVLREGRIVYDGALAGLGEPTDGLRTEVRSIEAGAVRVRAAGCGR